MLTRDGGLNLDTRRKLKQVLHLVQLLRPPLDACWQRGTDPVIADLGTGKSYLGFILYDLVVGPAGRGSIVGVDVRAELVERSQALAKRMRLRPHVVRRRRHRRRGAAGRPRRHGDGAACLRHRHRRRDPLRAAPQGQGGRADPLLPGRGRVAAGGREARADRPAVAPSDAPPRVRRARHQRAARAWCSRRTATRCA